MPFNIITENLSNLQTDALIKFTWPNFSQLNTTLQISETTTEQGKKIISVICVDAPFFIDNYLSAFKWAYERNYQSLAFIPILTVDYGLKDALKATKQFLENHELTIFIVADKAVRASITVPYLRSIKNYLQVCYPSQEIFSSKMSVIIDDDFLQSKTKRLLVDLEGQKGETFVQALFRMIDEKGLDDVFVYKKANIDRKLFSKIKSDWDYQPSKNTAISFALALELNLDETTDLLQKAGYALSDSHLFDLLIKYFIEHERYDLYEINEVLVYYHQKTLGTW
ncbi:MAG TPA: hypothetical protein PKG91_02935 [Bacilli bacterium]|nr:hypothetical protein [Bacilli bacterium]